MLKNNERSQEKFVSILSDGKMRLQVPEGTEGAIKRVYETSDKKSGTKWELVFTELSGVIEKISFKEGDYGKLIQLTVVDKEEEPVILSLGVNSSFAEDLMKKLPNIDLKKEVKIIPFSFEDEKQKKRKGITVYQGDSKINNFYYDLASKRNSNGYPIPKKNGKLTKSEWRKFFSEANDFLVEDISKRFNLEEDDEFGGL